MWFYGLGGGGGSNYLKKTLKEQGWVKQLRKRVGGRRWKPTHSCSQTIQTEYNTTQITWNLQPSLHIYICNITLMLLSKHPSFSPLSPSKENHTHTYLHTLSHTQRGGEKQDYSFRRKIVLNKGNDSFYLKH